MNSPDQETKHSDDLEKRDYGAQVEPVESDAGSGVHDVVAVHEHGPLRGLWRLVRKMEDYGVEARGIERVPESDRQHRHGWQALTMWGAANTTVATLGASIWFLDLRTSILCIIFFNLLSTLPVAVFSVWGARTGLRQMTLGRFSWGPYVVWVPTVLNLVACVGWSAINAIAGASALHAVGSDHKIPESASIVIITVVTAVVCIFGYRAVHLFEMLSFGPVVVAFFVTLGVSAQYFETGPWSPPGADTAAGVLSFGAALVGFGIGWSSLSADYTVRMPADTPAWQLFGWTYAGLNVPLILVESLGAACMSTFAARPDYEDAYNDFGVGGLLRACLSPAGGFGDFLVVVVGLGIISNNVPNLYSFGLTFQVLGRWAQAIPRVLITIVATGICIAIAIVAYNSFEESLDTLLVLLSYWLSIYCVILVEEHFLFRKGRWSNYDLTAYGDASRLPCGFAAAFAACAGVSGAAVGMASTWYVAPLALDISAPFGGDIGFELSAAFAGITYPPARYLERRIFGR